jgi:MraZ protein
MSLFVSTFTHKIDRKGRVSVPADFRDALVVQNRPGIVAYASPVAPAIRCSGLDLLEKIAEKRDPTDLFSVAAEDDHLALAAEIVRLGFDSEGRIQLSEELAQGASIAFDSHVTFVGKLRYFEIWDAARYQPERARTRARIGGASRSGNDNDRR